MADLLEAAVLEEIRKITGRKELQLFQRIYHDLGLTGDDACELLDNIHARFGTTFHKLDFHQYFTDEPDLLTSLLEQLFKSLIKEKPVTIQHLVEVVRAGQWFDP